jgi:surface protein
MKNFFTLTLCFLTLSLTAQETLTYPYNPDEDVNGLIASPDLLGLLSMYGDEFSPAEIMIGDTGLVQWIQILSQTLQAQQELIDQLQSESIVLPDGILSGDILIWNGTAWMPEPPPLDNCGVYGGDGSSCALTPITNDNINAAVHFWLSDAVSAEATYGHISDWDVSSVTNMYALFQETYFDDDISSWDVSSVTNMEGMFSYAYEINVDISSWNVSSVTNMGEMFYSATIFNGDISSWDVSSVTDMYGMFYDANSFNGDLSSWDVSSVTSMNRMFQFASSFNSDVSSWDVSSVTDMGQLFANTPSFNGDLSSWDVSSVTNMYYMFAFSYNFNGDLSSWDVSSVTNMSYMFDEALALSEENKCLIHTSFSSNSVWAYDWSVYCD